MAISLRVDPRTERLVERLARVRGLSKSDVIREAIVLLAAEQDSTVDGNAYEAIADLVGCVEGGPSDLSEHTGRRVRELLRAKRKRRSR